MTGPRARKPTGPRMTIPTRLVLRAMLAEPTREMCGLQICTAVPTEEGRPRRRYYELTRDGAERARIALAQATTSTSTLDLNPRPAGGPI